MQYKKKLFIIVIINIFLILTFLILSIPAYNYLTKNKTNNNDYVEGQVIINPEAKSPVILDRKIDVNLIAKVDKNLKWEFEPLEKNIKINIGESKIIKYKGKNISNKTITSTADFKVDPEAAQAYLIKTECFCFTEQTLKPGESQIFTMVFYVDPSIDSDWYFDNLKVLVFTYEFSEYKS